MAQYGDAVVLVQKSADGTISRTNAIVLASRIQLAAVNRSKDLRDFKLSTDKNSSGRLPAGEYVDLAYPNLGLAQGGLPLKSRAPELIFKLAYDVQPWKDGAWIGWQKPAVAPTPALAQPPKPADKPLQVKGK